MTRKKNIKQNHDTPPRKKTGMFAMVTEGDMVMPPLCGSPSKSQTNAEGSNRRYNNSEEKERMHAKTTTTTTRTRTMHARQYIMERQHDRSGGGCSLWDGANEKRIAEHKLVFHGKNRIVRGEFDP